MTIELRDVSYTYAGKYQRVTAVDTVSYTFQSGTMYSIMGASGSGKSTLLSLLAGLKLPTEGEIAFDEQPTRFMDRSALRRDTVSVIYQDFNLFPLLTALENIEYPMELCRVEAQEAERQARELARRVSLPDELLDRYPTHISGGEQQRVAIARGLTMDRRLLLADEPTGNLDSENSDNIIDLLLRLAHEENRCVIVVTHDLTVMDRADVVYRISDGLLQRRQKEQ